MAKDCMASSKFPKNERCTAIEQCLCWGGTHFSVNKMIIIRPRTVYSNVCSHSSSSNWRADWAWYSGKTYAQVLKTNPANQNQSQTSLKQVTYQQTSHSISDTVKSSKTQGEMSNKPVHPLAKKCVNIVNVQSKKFTPKPSVKDMNFVLVLSNRFSHICTDHHESELVSDQIINSVNTNKVGFSPKNTTKEKPHSRNTKIYNNGSQRWGQNLEQGTINNQNSAYQKTSKTHSTKNLQTEDEYDLELHITNKNKMRIAQAKHDPTYKQWEDQNSDRFGFIPLGPLLLPKTDKGIYLGSDPVALYDVVKVKNSTIFCLVKL